MIELQNDELIFAFPELNSALVKQAHTWIEKRIAEAADEEKSRLPGSRAELYAKFEWCIPKVSASISFQRTLRIPDDGKDYPLPPGLGRFPVRHVDDFSGVPDRWINHGGVMVPMHKTEALWLNFSADYPMAFKVGAGQICAISGERWSSTLDQTPQNYVVLPEQPWLDGFRVTEGVVRQFVAVPLGKGLTVEHQLTGQENWGGIQLQAFPLNVERQPTGFMEQMLRIQWGVLVRPPAPVHRSVKCSEEHCVEVKSSMACLSVAESGVGAGGRMKQEIQADAYGIEAWDASLTSRCFVHLCAADDWQRLTGMPPPHKPPTAKDYTNAGLPWFDYEAGKPAVVGNTALTGLKSVSTLVVEKTGLELPDNETIQPVNRVLLKPSISRAVREF